MAEDPKPADGGEPKPDPKDEPKPDPGKGNKFNASNTAHALARQSDAEIQEVLSIVALRKPELFAVEELDPTDPKPAPDPDPDPKPADNGTTEKLTGIEAEIQGLKEDSWRKSAMLKYGLNEEHARFIVGSSEKEIKQSALAYQVSVQDSIKVALEEVGAKPPEGDKDPPEKPPKPGEKDDPIPEYKGAQVKIDPEQAERDFLNSDIPDWQL